MVWNVDTDYTLKMKMRTQKGEMEISSWLLQITNVELPQKGNPLFTGCSSTEAMFLVYLGMSYQNILSFTAYEGNG